MYLTQLNQTISNAVKDSLTTVGNQPTCDITIPTVRGKSAYELAVDNGYVGSETAWLESLKVKGDKGVKGDTGTKGEDADITWITNELNQIKALREEDRNLINFLMSNLDIVKAIPVGGILTTTKHYTSGAALTAKLGYGKWRRFAQGRVLAGFSDTVTDIADYKTMGKEFGENYHTLTVSELPSHKHSQNNVFDKFTAKLPDLQNSNLQDNQTNTAHSYSDSTSDDEAVIKYQNWEVAKEQLIGSNQPHYNIQPTKVVAYWERMPDNWDEP